ncbi:hypothetical protein SSS_00224 [Sarcoptes scabiei]|uniref:Uncharacterized protein n=2 Tax=Sarcoptes scabiei TaxID=52283 RepID=A0A834RAP1_SARSC|nr:hypothetical protein SSS_00224 [Sarcoptes scabiei]
METFDRGSSPPTNIVEGIFRQRRARIVQSKRIIFRPIEKCRYFQSTNDYLITGNLNLLACQLLALKFPNLKMILISGCAVETEDLMMMLMEFQHLECFNLIICDNQNREIYFNSIIKIINICTSMDSIRNLKHFSLSLAHNVLTNPLSVDLMFQLEELYLHNVAMDYEHYFNEETANRSLQIQKLAIFNHRHQMEPYGPFAKLVSNTCTDLTGLYRELSIRKFNTVCEMFPLLTFLDIRIDHSIELAFFYSLTKISSLKEFRLRSIENCLILKDKSDQYYSSVEFSVPVTSVEKLLLDIDFEPMIFDLIPKIFPNIKALSVNLSRCCCACPNQPDLLDDADQNKSAAAITQGPVVEGYVNRNRPFGPNGEVIPVPNPNQNRPQQLNGQKNDDNIEYEIDNCVRCLRETLRTVNQWSQFRSLSVIGPRFKEESIDELKNLPKLRILSVFNCENFSLRMLVNAFYNIAGKIMPKETFVLRLNECNFNKILRLPNKPRNFLIQNCSPNSDVEYEMAKRVLKILPPKP